MRRLSLALVLGLAALSRGDDAKADLDRLQGSWSVVTLENDGKPTAKEGLKEARFTVKGDRYTSRAAGTATRGR